MLQKPKLIYCAGGSKRYAEIAIQNGFLYGARLPVKLYHDNLYFCDQNWKKPEKEKYIAAIKLHKPTIATVLDIESEQTRAEAYEWAEEIAPFVEYIIIIPKIEIEIPEKIGEKPIIIGYSVPSKYGATTIPIERFVNRKIHLLGGSPKKQIEIYKKYPQAIFSADGNSHMKVAAFNKFWSGKKWIYLRDYLPEPCAKDCSYLAFEMSCQNIQKMWQEEYEKAKNLDDI